MRPDTSRLPNTAGADPLMEVNRQLNALAHTDKMVQRGSAHSAHCCRKEGKELTKQRPVICFVDRNLILTLAEEGRDDR